MKIGSSRNIVRVDDGGERRRSTSERRDDDRTPCRAAPPSVFRIAGATRTVRERLRAQK